MKPDIALPHILGELGRFPLSATILSADEIVGNSGAAHRRMLPNALV